MAGIALIVAEAAADEQPVEINRAITVWVVEGFKLANVVAELKAPPPKLYSRSAPKGAVTTSVPVGAVQVGGTDTVRVGVAGPPDGAFTTTEAGADSQPFC